MTSDTSWIPPALVAGAAVLFLVLAVAAVGKWYRSPWFPLKVLKHLYDYADKVQIRTALPENIVAERLQTIIYRIGLFRMSRCLVGSIGFGKLEVELHRPFVQNGFAPVFDGVYMQRNGETYIEGVFRLSLFVRIFMTVWFGFVTLFLLLAAPVAILGLFAGNPESLVMILAPIVMIAFGFALLKIGKWFGRMDQIEIPKMLAEAVGGEIVRPDK